MSERSFVVEHATWASDRDALHAVRDNVFVREQNVPIELEWDELDPVCNHVLARDADGRPIGTGRLTPERKIGRMAVLRDWRGSGVGAAMLHALIERARAHGWTQLELHAQVDAIDFYRRFGFESHGQEFIEADIRHRRMRLALQPLQPPPAQRGAPAPRPVTQTLATASGEDAKAATLCLLADTHHVLAVHSRNLDPDVFDDDEVLVVLRRVAGSGRGASLRFLLHDPAQALRDGHRLMILAQRLPSAVQLRVPVEKDDLTYASAFVLNDVGGYYLNPLAGHHDGRGSTCDPREHRVLQRYFDAVWERARPATELRALAL